MTPVPPEVTVPPTTIAMTDVSLAARRLQAATPSRQAARTIGAADAAVAVSLAAIAAYCVWLGTGLAGHIPLLLDVKSDDVWFEADVMRVFANMTDRFSDHFRSQVHPLFSLCAYGLFKLFAAMPGISKLTAVRLTIASSAAMWVCAFFSLLRVLGCRRLDTVVFSMVAATSASAFFWTTIPETYLFSSLTIVLVLLGTAYAQRRPIPAWLDVGVAAAALSMLVTNWMFALISLAARHRLRVAIQLAANAFVVVVLLWAVQKFFFPSAHFFLGDHEKWPHVKALTVPPIFFLDTMVMPDFISIPNDHDWLWTKLSVQGVLSWRLTWAGPIALAAWSVLLFAGAWAMTALKGLGTFRLVLASSIACQLALHAFYGNESFLYALNWLPLLVTVAALSSLTRLRWVGLTAACIFVLSAGFHNFKALDLALHALIVKAS